MGLLDYGTIKRKRFQTFLGTGFKSNNFYVEIRFPSASPTRKDSIDHVYNRMKKDWKKILGPLPWYMMLRTPNIDLDTGKISPVIDGLITKAQIPGYNVTALSDTFPYLQRIQKGTFSPQTVTLDFINDQYNVQWIWWRNYMQYNKLYEVQYPINYECEISIYLQSSFKVDYYKVTFEKCILTKIPNLDLAYSNTTIPSLKLDFAFVKMTVKEFDSASEIAKNIAVGGGIAILNLFLTGFIKKDQYINARDRAIRNMKRTVALGGSASVSKDVIGILNGIIVNKIDPVQIADDSYILNNNEGILQTQDQKKVEINSDLVYNISEKNHKDKYQGRFKDKDNISDAEENYNTLLQNSSKEARNIVRNLVFEKNLEGNPTSIKDITETDYIKFLSDITNR